MYELPLNFTHTLAVTAESRSAKTGGESSGRYDICGDSPPRAGGRILTNAVESMNPVGFICARRGAEAHSVLRLGPAEYVAEQYVAGQVLASADNQVRGTFDTLSSDTRRQGDHLPTRTGRRSTASLSATAPTRRCSTVGTPARTGGTVPPQESYPLPGVLPGRPSDRPTDHRRRDGRARCLASLGGSAAACGSTTIA